LIFPQFDSLTEFSILFYKALETDAFLLLEDTYLLISRDANSIPAKKAANAQSIGYGMCT
jgi:hypothetical protein